MPPTPLSVGHSPRRGRHLVASQVALGVVVSGKHFSRTLGRLENGAIFPARVTEMLRQLKPKN